MACAYCGEKILGDSVNSGGDLMHPSCHDFYMIDLAEQQMCEENSVDLYGPDYGYDCSHYDDDPNPYLGT